MSDGIHWQRWYFGRFQIINVFMVVADVKFYLSIVLVPLSISPDKVQALSFVKVIPAAEKPTNLKMIFTNLSNMISF